MMIHVRRHQYGSSADDDDASSFGRSTTTTTKKALHVRTTILPSLLLVTKVVVVVVVSSLLLFLLPISQVSAYTPNNNSPSSSSSSSAAAVPVPHHLRPHHAIFHQIATTTNAAATNNNNDNTTTRKNHHHCLWIDMENVRGKSGFELSHRQVLEKTASFAEHFSLQHQVVVVVDHGGPEASAYYHEPSTLAIAFSGNHAKADDVIAHGIASASDWLLLQADNNNNNHNNNNNNNKIMVGTMVVVTADHELQSRCRRASKVESLHIMEPQTFLDDLEWVAMQQQQQQQQAKQQQSSLSLPQTTGKSGGDDDGSSSSSSPPMQPLNEQIKLGKLDAEIRLRGQLLDAEIQLDRKRSGKYMTKKRRKKMESRVQALRRKLALRGPSLLDQLTASSSTASSSSSPSNEGTANDSDTALDWTNRISREEQDMLLARWRELQHRATRKEQTGDRVIYAERLRRELEEDDDALMLIHETGFQTSSSSVNGGALPSAKAFVRHINQGVLRNRQRKQEAQSLKSVPTIIHADHMVDDASVEPPEISTKQRLAYQSKEKLQTLDLVVISDTHGYEGQFDYIPSGDVLLHLGDFASEGSTFAEQRGLAAFDKWLARQPHNYKIVIRGNHDPFSAEFPVSKALYVTTPTSVNIGGFEMALVPHGAPRKLAASGGIPPTCDIIASHLPPYKTLDRTYSGKFAGSSFLCNVVRGMPLGPPPLWLVGHIHEGRGTARRQFGRHKENETLVINAANANNGKATHLTHGPVAVRVEKDNPNPQILSMDDMSINQAPCYKDFFDATKTDDDVEESEVKEDHLLMAVDLGLKSGISLFNSNGNLVRYEQFQFQRETLEENIPSMIEQWQSQAGQGWKITHIAIEGGDTALLGMWERNTPGISSLRVRPEEWRAELLTSKENKDGASAKAASRLIARQMVEDYGTMEQHTGKFQTDVAEAVLLGTHVARRLGWIKREPAVRRYTNGNVITPRKTAATK